MLNKLLNIANTVILGKETQIKLAISCLLARGHLLIEDLPGMGKTTLSHLLARLFGLEFTRIQFTSDLLPADIIGINIFDKNKTEFKFVKGPLFSQLVLADEINRASAKTQSALLEAMEEYQVSVDKITYPLDKPFIVIATQNPHHQSGTFPLPESQLDRFLMRLQLGYPDIQTERKILLTKQKKENLDKINPVFSPQDMIKMQGEVDQVYVSEPIIDIVQQILSLSRNHPKITTGLSPRAGISMVNAAKAWAYIHKREMVIPDDIKAVLASVILHRLQSNELESLTEQQLLSEFEKIPMM